MSLIFSTVGSESKAEDTQEPEAGMEADQKKAIRASEVDQTEAETMETKAEHAEAANLSDENDVFQVPQAADRTRAISSPPAATSLASQRRRKRGIYNKINPRKKRRASQVESEPEESQGHLLARARDWSHRTIYCIPASGGLYRLLLILLNLMIMLIM